MDSKHIEDDEVEQLHIEEVFESEKITHHVVEQRGLDLVCTSCYTPHAQVRFFKPGQILSQNEKGDYIILSIDEDAAARKQ